MAYQKTIQAINSASDLRSSFQREAAYEAHLISLPFQKRYDDFYQACSCLLVSGPHFEKYLVFALLLFVSFTFAPGGERGRKYLAVSHTAVRTPRTCLTRDLPGFRLADPPPLPDHATKNASRSSAETQRTLQDCLVWIWLVLIESWTATDGANSKDAMELERKFKLRFPEYATPERVDAVWTKLFRMDDTRPDIGEIC